MPVPDHGEMRERAFIHRVLVSPMVRVDGPLRSAGCSFMISDPAQIPNAGWGNLRNHKDERSAANDVPFRIHMTSASIRTPNSDPDAAPKHLLCRVGIREQTGQQGYLATIRLMHLETVAHVQEIKLACCKTAAWLASKTTDTDEPPHCLPTSAPLNVPDFRLRAQRRLPRMVFDFLEAVQKTRPVCSAMSTTLARENFAGEPTSLRHSGELGEATEISMIGHGRCFVRQRQQSVSKVGLRLPIFR